MASCARAILLAALFPFQAFAQTESEGPVVPAALEERILESIADYWVVPADRVELEWGRIIGDIASMRADTEFRLLPGTGASFVVTFTFADGSPMAVRLRAGVLDTVAVASRPLVAGTVLGAGDVTMTESTRWGPPPAQSTSRPGAGWVVRRMVASGAVLAPPLVEPPLLVQAGGRVTLVWQRDRVSVSIEGAAINGGALGDEVRVRLDNQRGRVRGVVTGPGVARLVSRGDR